MILKMVNVTINKKHVAYIKYAFAGARNTYTLN
jgi:hypothetical protein